MMRAFGGLLVLAISIHAFAADQATPARSNVPGAAYRAFTKTAASTFGSKRQPPRPCSSSAAAPMPGLAKGRWT